MDGVQNKWVGCGFGLLAGCGGWTSSRDWWTIGPHLTGGNAVGGQTGTRKEV